MGKLMKNEMNAINATLAQTITDIQALRPTVEDMRYELTHIFGATDVASGSVASFSDGAGGVFAKSVKVNITPSQSGSGDPSPNNIRPISGYTQAVITNQGSGRTNSATVDFPTTIYGGSLNLTTGELVVDRGFATFDGSSDESWTVGSANAAISISDMPSGSNMSGLSNMYVIGSSAGKLRLGNSNNKLYLVSIVSTQGITTLAQLQTFLSGNPLQVVYPLATPQTYQLSPKQLLQFTLDNNISANCGTVEVTYRLNLNTAIERLQGA